MTIVNGGGNGHAGAAHALDSQHAIEAAIRASIAPLVQRQHELEAQLRAEAGERVRLQEQVRLLQVQSLGPAAAADALPDMLNASRRRRVIAIGILVFMALILTALISASVVSQSR